MNKKFLAMLMALAMIISMVPMAAMAASDTCSKNNVSGNHGYTTGPHLDATCGKDGYTSQVCEWCSEELTRTIVPATGNHNWKVVFRTETEVKYHCDGCNQDKTERIETVCKHEHQDTETVAATCGRDGVTKQICKDCGAVVRENVIEATGDHHWEVEYKCDATETEDGWIRYTCDGCNQSYTDIIPATGADNEVPEDTTPVNPYLDNVPRTGSFFLEWLYALIFG